MIIYKTDSEIDSMAQAGSILADTFKILEPHVSTDILTRELNDIADEFIRSQGATPSFLGYHGFPASICTSLNSVVVHGIPNKTRLQDGDVLSIDIGVTFEGLIADSAKTYAVGDVSDEARRLIEVCEASLVAGVEAFYCFNEIGDISEAVETVAENAGFGVIREVVGHGVGRDLHEDPAVPNFTSSSPGPVIKPGMTLAIEPMIIVVPDHPMRQMVSKSSLTIGNTAYAHESASYVPDKPVFGVMLSEEDGWSLLTTTGTLAAHFEHTVAMTSDRQVRVLTR